MSAASLRPLIWAAVRQLADSDALITTTAVRGLLRRPPSGCLERIGEYLRALAAAGILEPDAAANGAYRLARDIGAEAPRLRADGSEIPESANQALWRCMRILGEFTAAELAAHAATEQRPISVATAHTYAKRLARIGFLRRVAGPSAAWRYCAPRSTGPLAPRIRRDKHVVDPNNGAVYAPDGQEVRHDR